jgi:VWFA-related protein
MLGMDVHEHDMRALKHSNVIAAAVMLLIVLCSGSVSAQNNDQQIPDAPSATRPFPKPSAPPAAPPAGQESQPGEPGQPSQAPPPNITTVPEGEATKDPASGRDQMLTFSKTVNFVQVPVTVKDDRGRLVAGLLPRDFQVLEDGKPQPLKFFTSDPFPLAAAVVLDLAMPEVEFAKVRDTLPALVGAFGQFDEVALYTYGSSVTRVQGFTPAQNDVFIQNIKHIQKTLYGRAGGAPVVGGPFGSGPTVNGRPADPGAAVTINAPQNSTIYRPEAHVLNDAILAAAQDLASRDRTRRKVLFIISNGRELNSDASYSQVLKVLLTQQITVYGVAVGESAIPIYDKLNKIHLPGQGYGDILPKYAAATGGQTFSEFSTQAIETAYNQVTVVAKNQYTLGYTTSDTKSTNYREIEVRVLKPDLRVTARAGYYPLPPPPPNRDLAPGSVQK